MSDEAAAVLIVVFVMIGVQLLIITVGLAAIRHDVRRVLLALEPWLPADPPRVRRAVRWGWRPKRRQT